MSVRGNKKFSAIFLVLVLTISLFLLIIPAAKAAFIGTWVNSLTVEPSIITADESILFIVDFDPDGHIYHNIQFHFYTPEGGLYYTGYVDSDINGVASLLYTHPTVLPDPIGTCELWVFYAGDFVGSDFYLSCGGGPIYFDVLPANQPPVADAGGPYTGTEGEAVSFDGSASYDTDGTITDYLWSFGDGQTSTEQNPTHTYTQDGTYTVTLTVTDNNLETDDDTTTADISDTDPIASLSVSPSFGPGGVDVELTGSGYPPSASVTLSYYDSALDLWNVLDAVSADPSGDIAYTTEVPDLRRSQPLGDNAEMYALVSYRSEVDGAVQGYADYSQYLRGMKTVGDQTASGLFGNGTNLSSVVQVGAGDSLSLVGKWFHPGVVYVRWDGEVVVGTVTSDEWLDAQIIGTAVANQEEGYFETMVTIPASDPGEHYISIEDSETKLILIVYFGDSSNLEWSVDLFASSDEYYDLSTFGVAVDATSGFDAAYDSVDPPSPPNGLASYFYYPDNPSLLQKLSTSIISSAPTMSWDYRVFSVDVSGSVSISWSSDEISTIPSEKGVYLICPDDLVVDMRSTTSYSFGAEADSTYLFEVIVGGVDYVVDLDAGWNMVSFPCIPEDASFSSIFSDVGFYQVLTWDGSGYVTLPIAEAGIGYWVLVLEETTISIENAIPVTSYTKSLPAGWSMIGSIYGESVNADDVFPGFYQLLTWDGSGYVTSTIIESGKGYWALVLEPTTITV